MKCCLRLLKGEIFMKTVKKIIAVMMAVITALSLFIVSASAAQAPTFELKVVSQDSSKAVIELSIVSGTVNSLDITFSTSSAIKSINYIITTDAFDAYVKELQKQGGQCASSSYVATKKISLASTIGIKDTSIYQISVNKKSSADLVADDFKANCTECVVNGTSVVSSVKIQSIFGKLEINEESVALNYKTKTKLNLTTALSAKDIVWESSNTKVATVDANGNVYAAGTGSATITAKNEKGTISDTCKVTVSYAWWQWIIVIVLFGWLWY